VYRWARGLVEKQEFTVAVDDIKRLREEHNRLVEVAGQVRKELNAVLTLYSQSGFSKETNLLNELEKHLGGLWHCGGAG
jgi:hypothetical protein